MSSRGAVFDGRGAGWRLAGGVAFWLVLGGAGSVVVAQEPSRAAEELPVFRALERIARDAGASVDDRLAALVGLGDARHPSSVPTLVETLGDPVAPIRAGAAAALGWPGHDAVVGLLAARAQDATETREVRVAAIDALGRIGAVDAVGPVEDLSRDADVGIRRAALLALVESSLARHTDQIGAAVRLLDDAPQDGHTRARAAVLLGGAPGDARALPALRSALRETQPPAGYDALPMPGALTGMQQTMAQRLRSLHNVRAHAAWALGTLGNRAAVPDLLTVLGDPDPAVRLRSVGALGLLQAREAVPHLTDLMHDRDVLVRAAVATALGAMDDRSAAPTLREALGDADARVRERAARALGQLRDEEARGELQRLAATEPVPSVRLAAHDAIRALDAARDAGSSSDHAPAPSN